jgi:Leucine-rich repeat (LRR) protein
MVLTRSTNEMDHFTTDRMFFLQFTSITELPPLPSNLLNLVCNNTEISTIPSLPKGLLQLVCSHTNVSTLPELPPTLEVLLCNDTDISTLPPLPDSLLCLHCHNTPLTSLPELPPNLQYLICSNTNLTELPELPTMLRHLECNNVPLSLQRYGWHETVHDYNLRWREWREDRAGIQRSRERCLAVKEELMAAAWHPRRVERWVEVGGVEMLEAL